jgi:hypothetical protein
MGKRSQANLQAAARKCGAKSEIDFELFEHLHRHRAAMRVDAQDERHGIDEVARNMVRTYDMVLNYGRFFEPTPRPKQYKAGDRNQCYGNSLDLFIANEGLNYCEGYVVVKGALFPAEHGWCITEDGSVVDVTLRKPLLPLAYFGVVFNSLFAASRDLPAIESVLIENAEPTAWRAKD